MSASDANPDYVLGTSTAELRRLGFQHRAWAPTCSAHLQRAGIAPGQRWLDLGCGPGLATLDLAHLVGSEGHVLAVDQSPRFLEHVNGECARLEIDWVETRHSEAAELDLRAASLDGVYARWVFCFLRDPAAVVQRIAAALKPGGRLLVLDYLRYLSADWQPSSPALRRGLEAAYRSWAETGGNLEVGAELPALVERAGLRVREAHNRSFIVRPGSLMWQWPKTFFFGFLPELVEKGVLAAGEWTAFEAAFLELERTPGAFFLTPPQLELTAERA